MMRDEPSTATWRASSSASSGSVDILPHVDTSADEITMCRGSNHTQDLCDKQVQIQIRRIAAEPLHIGPARTHISGHGETP